MDIDDRQAAIKACECALNIICDEIEGMYSLARRTTISQLLLLTSDIIFYKNQYFKDTKLFRKRHVPSLPYQLNFHTYAQTFLMHNILQCRPHRKKNLNRAYVQLAL